MEPPQSSSGGSARWIAHAGRTSIASCRRADDSDINNDRQARLGRRLLADDIQKHLAGSWTGGSRRRVTILVWPERTRPSQEDHGAMGSNISRGSAIQLFRR